MATSSTTRLRSIQRSPMSPRISTISSKRRSMCSLMPTHTPRIEAQASRIARRLGTAIPLVQLPLTTRLSTTSYATFRHHRHCNHHLHRPRHLLSRATTRCLIYSRISSLATAVIRLDLRRISWVILPILRHLLHRITVRCLDIWFNLERRPQRDLDQSLLIIDLHRIKTSSMVLSRYRRSPSR